MFSILVVQYINHRKEVREMCTHFPTLTLLLNGKAGVCTGIAIFLILDAKHRLWVLVRTASPRRFYRVHTINVLRKHIKIIKIFAMIFSSEKKKICMLNGFSSCKRKMVMVILVT